MLLNVFLQAELWPEAGSRVEDFCSFAQSVWVLLRHISCCLLDLVGCLNITAKSLEALKASLQYRNKIDFDISIDGSTITKKQAY